jgi:alpha-L-fucosidase
VREILTNYGDIAVLWWDTPTDMTDEFAEKLNALLALQPNIITNDRLKRPNYPGDYKTPEQRIPKLEEIDGKDWETCMTMNNTWGYKSYDNEWKSTETIIRNTLDIASKGGNYLLNVGPTAEGLIPEPSIQRLKEVGQWMKKYGEAIYGTKASPLAPLAWGRCTQKHSKGNTILYLSVFKWPADGKLVVPGLKNKVVSAKLVGEKKKLNTASENGSVVISVTGKAIDPIATVISLEVEGIIQPVAAGAQKAMEAGEVH